MKQIKEYQLPDHHQEILDRFVLACQKDDRIVAAFLGGSHAKGKSDQFSDLDLYFITTDDAYEEFTVKRENFVQLLGKPLFLEDFGLSHGFCIIFSNETECDLWFGRESKYEDIYSGPYRVLIDKKGIMVSDHLPRQKAEQSKQIQILRQQLDWFWHELSHFIKALGREQLWFAYGQIEAMRQICVVLARLAYDFSDTHASGEPYFKIEKEFPVERLSSLINTYCLMEYDAMFQAALDICKFYRELAPGLAKRYNLAYQYDLEKMLLGQLKGMRNSSSN